MKYEIPKLFTISLIAQRITRYVDGHSRSIEPYRKCDGSICIVIYTNVTKHIACENKKEYFLRKSVMLTKNEAKSPQTAVGRDFTLGPGPKFDIVFVRSALIT